MKIAVKKSKIYKILGFRESVHATYFNLQFEKVETFFVETMHWHFLALFCMQWKLNLQLSKKTNNNFQQKLHIFTLTVTNETKVYQFCHEQQKYSYLFTKVRTKNFLNFKNIFLLFRSVHDKIVYWSCSQSLSHCLLIYQMTCGSDCSQLKLVC